MRKRLPGCIVLAALLAAASAVAWAQGPAWPNRPVRLVVGFAAGGPTDLQARVVAKKLSEALGQSVVVENRGGAGSMIAAELVAKAPPDGYTLFFATISITIAPATYAKPPFDPTKDFSPVTMISTAPFFMVVHPSVPAKTLQDYVALARARPGQLTFATSGNGTPPHLLGEILKSNFRIDLVHIPHKGAAPALTDLLGGQVSMSFINPLIALPQMQTGKLRALASTAAKRSATAPDVPTMSESGLPGLEIGSWFSIVGPAGLPKDIVARLHAENLRAIATPEVKSRLEADGSDPVGLGPEELAAYIRTEYDRWTRIARQAGLRTE